jgi:N-acetylmuramoyl-L-alanine amidase
LCRDIVTRCAIRPDRVLAHSDVAPHRKNDPGEKFPWERLHQAGVGLWVPPVPIGPGAIFVAGDTGPEIAELQRGLARYGYALAATGIFDPATRQVVTAFQRHFRPARVDGVADSSTLRTLQALLAARGDSRSVP